MPNTRSNYRNGDIARCHIPQEAFLSGATYLVSAFSAAIIIEAYMFKRDVRNGAIELKQTKFANLIQEQMNILDEAMTINEKADEQQRE